MQTVSFGILRPQSSLTALSVMYLARAIPRRRSWIPARDVDRHRDVGRHPRGRQIPKSQIESQIESSTVVHLLVLLLRPSKLRTIHRILYRDQGNTLAATSCITGGRHNAVGSG